MTPDSFAQSRTAPLPVYQRGPHWVALFAAAFTWPLIFVGGSVTTYRVGMAVPDWPTTFGINMFLYNFWNAPFGVRVEHTHRLYGAAVGLATVVLAAWFFLAERRRSMKLLGVFALLAVIGQGVLGGIRVRQNSTLLAAVHGVTAQAFFALMVSLCVLTGRDWIESTVRRPDPDHLRRRAGFTLLLIAVQIVLGAWLRHFPSTMAVMMHAVAAVAVASHAALLWWRVERAARVPAPEREAPIAPIKTLRPAARAMILAVTLQVVLGVTAWWMLRPFDGIPRTVSIVQALVRTGHQANGALLVASSVVLMLRTSRHLAPTAQTVSAGTAVLDWEAVA